MDQSDGYATIQRRLHWAIAVLVLANLIGGLTIASLGFEGLTERFGKAGTNTLFLWHKTFGVLVLVLMIWRLAVRRRHGAPALPETVPASDARIAHVSHLAFYGLLIALPAVGWLATDLGGYPVEFFGLDLGVLGKDKAASDLLFRLHGMLGFAVGMLAILHIGAALRHWMRGDGIIERISLR